MASKIDIRRPASSLPRERDKVHRGVGVGRPADRSA